MLQCASALYVLVMETGCKHAAVSSIHLLTHAACLQAASKAKGAAKDVQNKAGNPLQGLNKVCLLL